MISTYRIPSLKKQVANQEILIVGEEYELKDAIHNKSILSTKILNLKNSNINDETLSLLWTITQKLQIIEINLAQNFSFITDVGIEHLCQAQNINQLKILNLADISITDLSIERISSKFHFSKLQTLILYGNSDITSQSLIYLAESDHIKNIKTLDLHATSVCDKGLKIFLKSQNSSKLEHLNLAMNWKRVTDVTPKSLATSKHCSSLIQLNFEDCFITDDGMQSLSDSPNCSKMQILNLNNSIKQKNNLIGDGSLTSLAYAKEMSKLKILELRNTDVTSKGIKSLSVSLSAQNLQKLRLSHCRQIKDEAILYLQSIIEYRNIKKIYLNSTMINKDQFQKVEKRYPNINLIF